LPSSLFKRIHRSFIVSVKKIDSYNAEMVDVSGAQIPIGRGYKDVVDNL
jgi:two-component system, LytTR family, response regulator